MSESHRKQVPPHRHASTDIVEACDRDLTRTRFTKPPTGKGTPEYFDKTIDTITDVANYTIDPPNISVVAESSDTAEDFSCWFKVTITRIDSAGGYLIAYKKTTETEYTKIAVDQPPTGNPVVIIRNLEPDTWYDIKSCSLTQKTQASEWSDPATHLTASNLIPPPIPTAIIATSMLAGVFLTWDRVVFVTDPSDFAYYKIYRSNINNPTTASLVGETPATVFIWRVTDPLTQYITQYFWITSVDSAGNESAKSTSASAAPHKTGYSDLAANSVHAEQIYAGSVTADKVDANIAILNKIWVGTITGKTLQTAETGNRVVMSSAGFKAYGEAILCYDQGGTFRGGITAESTGIIIGAPTGYIKLGSYLEILAGNTLRPETTSIWLGTASYPWYTAYINIEYASEIYPRGGHGSGNVGTMSNAFFNMGTDHLYANYIQGIAGEFVKTQSLVPITSDTRYIGSSTSYYNEIYCNHLHYIDQDVYPWDTVDDLALIENYPIVTAERNGQSVELIDPKYFDFLRDENGFWSTGKLNGFLFGCLKKLVKERNAIKTRLDAAETFLKTAKTKIATLESKTTALEDLILTHIGAS